MSENQLALLGGPKTIHRDLKLYNSYGDEETRAAADVVASGQLSRFVGAWGSDFLGGPRVKEFERAWETAFRVSHAISVNSATSGLIAAVGAIGIEPGDEVILSPWTMCASATSIVVWGGIPVFADIETDTFNLDPAAVVRAITPRTRAIMLPNIFGHAAQLDEIMAIAHQHGLKVIEDASQSPGAMYKGRYVGTVADIGVFSLNYHKHIHTGEGGVCVTNDRALAEKMQLIRNHAEAAVVGKGTTELTNMVGFNFRLGEIEAAMGLTQLRKLEKIADRRSEIGARLNGALGELAGLKVPRPLKDCTHVYYVHGLVMDEKIVGVSRTKILEALQAEGVGGVRGGYANVHLLPMFQQKIALGSKHFPWSLQDSATAVNYRKGICPRAEELHDKSMIMILTCHYDYPNEDVDLVIQAFRKVWSNLDALK